MSQRHSLQESGWTWSLEVASLRTSWTFVCMLYALYIYARPLGLTPVLRWCGACLDGSCTLLTPWGHMGPWVATIFGTYMCHRPMWIHCILLIPWIHCSMKWIAYSNEFFSLEKKKNYQIFSQLKSVNAMFGFCNMLSFFEQCTWISVPIAYTPCHVLFKHVTQTWQKTAWPEFTYLFLENLQ